MRSDFEQYPVAVDAGSAVPSRVSLLISILRLNLVLTHGIPPDFRNCCCCVLHINRSSLNHT